MKKAVVEIVGALLLGICAMAFGNASLVINGSFERDDDSFTVTPSKTPYYWCEVNLPSGKFTGSVWGDTFTHRRYYLGLSAMAYVDFDVNDTGYIAQQVYLDEANEVIFDLRLDTGYAVDKWDPNQRSAVLLIDGEVVWESNSVGTDVRGVYLDQSYVIEPRFKDGQLHSLGLGLRANTEGAGIIDYYADWDFVKFDAYCGGFGFLGSDFNRDCSVNLGDYALLAADWLSTMPESIYDLHEDGNIDVYDLGAFAGQWLDYIDWQEAPDIEPELMDEDFDLSGEVDAGDLAIFVENWLFEQQCGSINLDGEGVVNLKDFAIFAGKWGQRNWLYYRD